jgi:hypothetical protein
MQIKHKLELQILAAVEEVHHMDVMAALEMVEAV